VARRTYRTITYDGPFFTKDPTKTFRGNARSMLRQMALEGARDVRAQLIPGEATRRPISVEIPRRRVSQHVAASVPYTPGASKVGNILANVYVPNFGYSRKQGVALMAAYAEVARQTGAFPTTTRRLRRSRKANAAELLKGLT
jgi:hypothetical protein